MYVDIYKPRGQCFSANSNERREALSKLECRSPLWSHKNTKRCSVLQNKMSLFCKIFPIGMLCFKKHLKIKNPMWKAKFEKSILGAIWRQLCFVMQSSIYMCWGTSRLGPILQTVLHRGQVLSLSQLGSCLGCRPDGAQYLHLRGTF